jgi:hypothetical protein
MCGIVDSMHGRTSCCSWELQLAGMHDRSEYGGSELFGQSLLLIGISQKRIPIVLLTRQ